MRSLRTAYFDEKPIDKLLKSIPGVEKSNMPKQKPLSPWPIAYRVLLTAAMIAWIVFIFFNSLQNGSESTERSFAAMELINRILGFLHFPPVTQHFVRKLAHFTEFAILGGLLLFCLRSYTPHAIRYLSLPMLGGMTTALCDETLQYLSDGRAPSVIDVWIDTAGVVTGALSVLCLLLLVGSVSPVYWKKRGSESLRT